VGVDPTADPNRNTLFAIIGLVVVAIVIVLGVVVFLRHPTSQPGCTAVSGGPAASSPAPQLNCQ
jgi:hypothetical protein